MAPSDEAVARFAVKAPSAETHIDTCTASLTTVRSVMSKTLLMAMLLFENPYAYLTIFQVHHVINIHIDVLCMPTEISY